MKISIIGAGYVGLVTGACLSERGHQVVCVDLDRRKIEMINAGRAPIHEHGLAELLARNAGPRLRGTSDLVGAIAATDVTFIAIGTPSVGGKIDLRLITAAASEIGTALSLKTGYHTVIVKSTVVPGSTAGLIRKTIERASGKMAGRDFGLGMNPEFLSEGTAVKDFSTPDRIVLGGIDSRTHETLCEVYASFDDSVPRILTNLTTAEMIKYASNAVLATLISFSNEIARLAATIGDVDAIDVMRGVHESGYFTTRRGTERITAEITSFLEPGCGFGGSCLPKDVAALIGQGSEHGLNMGLLRSVMEINYGQSAELLRLIDKHVACLRGVNVTVLGLSFKPDTDDVRESPAFPLIRALKSRGAHVTVYDPVARPEGHDDLEGVTCAAYLEDALANCQVVILVTQWAEFSAIPGVLRELGRDPLVVDGRRMFPASLFRSYEGIGR